MDLSFYKGKRVLITGHTGFKGTWMCQVLVSAGAEVIGYALEAPTNPSLFEMCGLQKKINSVTGDVRDLDKMKKVFQETQPGDSYSYGSTAACKRILSQSRVYI